MKTGQTVKAIQKVVTKGKTIEIGTHGIVENTFKPIHSIGCWDVLREIPE